MQSCVCCRVRLVTSNPPRMIASAPKAPGSKHRSTHGHPNYAAGRSRKFCFPAITPRSRSGAKNKRSSAHARIARIYSDNAKLRNACHPERRRGTSHSELTPFRSTWCDQSSGERSFTSFRMTAQVLVAHAPEDHARIDSAETERIAHDII